MAMGRHRRGGDRGFTLIEMLVVIAIIGSILAVAMPRFLPIILYSTHEGAARHLAMYGRAAMAEASLSRARLYVRFGFEHNEYWVEHIPDPPEDESLPTEVANDDDIPQDDDELRKLAEEELDNRAEEKGTDDGQKILKEQSTRMAEDSNLRARKALIAKAARIHHDERALPRSVIDDLKLSPAERARREEMEPVEYETPLLGRTKLPKEVQFAWITVGGVEHNDKIVTVEIGPAGLDVEVEFGLVNLEGNLFVVTWDPVGGTTSYHEEAAE